MKKMILCSILIMSMFCSCSDKLSSTDQAGKDTVQNSNVELKEIDMFENVDLIDCLDFDKCSFENYQDGMHNLYPISATWNIYDNPYWNEYAKEYGKENDIDGYYTYEMDHDVVTVTASEETIGLKFSYKDEDFDEFLQKHNYKVASYTKEYHIKPEKCESEILNENMYTNSVAKDVDRIINEEISKNEDFSDYEIFQKYLMLPADEFEFGNSILPPSIMTEDDLDARIHLHMIKDCKWGIIAILKDKNSESYIRARVRVILKDERVVESLFELASDKYEDRQVVNGVAKWLTTVYSNPDECYDGIENNCDNLHTVDLSKINKYVAVDY